MAIKYGEEHKTDKSVIMTIAGAMNAQIDYDAFEKGIEQGELENSKKCLRNA